MRWAGEKVGGVLQEAINSLADKADELKGKKDKSFGKAKELGEKSKGE
ncbi:MAG: CsbD family protein [Nitrospirae bacterium]|nr:CsbD family protein [Nitrospirota bacterium]